MTLQGLLRTLRSLRSTKNEKGKVAEVRFGDPNMGIKIVIMQNRKSFRANIIVDPEPMEKKILVMLSVESKCKSG